MNWQLNEWKFEKMNKWIMGSEQLIVSAIWNKRANEWMSEWMNEWTNEWMNEWLNGWINEGIHFH